MKLEQTTTDTVELETFGPVTLCTFKWGGAKKDVALLVSTSAAQRVAKKRVRRVDAMRNLEELLVLTDEGLDVVRRFGVMHLFSWGRVFDTGYDQGVVLYQADDAAEIRALLEGLSWEDVKGKVFASYNGLALFDPESALDASPLNDLVYFDISNSYVDVEAAQMHLEAHPLVKAVKFDRGRPGSYDHVPSSLHLIVTLPDDVRAAIEEQYRNQHKLYIRKGERCAASPSYFGQEFTWSLISTPNLYGDLLGLAQFARKRYNDPPDEDDSDWS